MNKLLTVLFATSAVSGCATVTHDSMQPIKVETRLADGSSLSGADCKLSNDYGSVSCKSGDTIQVHRSSQDLDIVCKMGDQPDALGRAISRANAGMFGNILIGGGIGAIVDHTRGTAYTYPTWIQLSYGKTLVFDRQDEKDGQPLAGNEVGNGQPTPSQAGSSSSPDSVVAKSATPAASIQ